MKRRKNIFTVLHITSAVVMVLALVWLTVSTPFVYADQQAKKEMAKKQYEKDAKSDAENNPVSNSSEEKVENGLNTLSEYLHEPYIFKNTSCIIVQYYKCHLSDLYFAYHPELLSPPPEA